MGLIFLSVTALQPFYENFNRVQEMWLAYAVAFAKIGFDLRQFVFAFGYIQETGRA